MVNRVIFAVLKTADKFPPIANANSKPRHLNRNLQASRQRNTKTIVTMKVTLFARSTDAHMEEGRACWTAKSVPLLL